MKPEIRTRSSSEGRLVGQPVTVTSTAMDVLITATLVIGGSVEAHDDGLTFAAAHAQKKGKAKK